MAKKREGQQSPKQEMIFGRHCNPAYVFFGMCIGANILICRSIAHLAAQQQQCINSLESEVARKNHELRRLYSFVATKRLTQDLAAYQLQPGELL